MSINNINQLREAQERSKDEGGLLLGAIISWKVNPQIKISRKLFEQLLSLNKVPVCIQPQKRTEFAAFKLAVNKCRKLLPKYLLRYVKTEHKQIVLGIVKEETDTSKELLEYNCAAVVKIKENNSNISIVNKIIDYNSISPDVFSIFLTKLQEEFDKYLEVTSEDIRALLRNFTSSFCVRINPHGGGYFCPNSYQNLLNSVKQLVNDCDDNCESQLYCFELYDSQQNQNDMGIIVKKSLEEEIKTLEEEIKSFKKEAIKDYKSFEKGLEIRNNKLKAIEARVKVFKEVLDFKANNLAASLQDLQLALLPENPLLTELKKLENNLSSSVVSEKNKNEVEF